MFIEIKKKKDTLQEVVQSGIKQPIMRRNKWLLLQTSLQNKFAPALNYKQKYQEQKWHRLITVYLRLKEMGFRANRDYLKINVNGAYATKKPELNIGTKWLDNA